MGTTKFTLENIQDVYKKKNYQFLNEINIIGVRKDYTNENDAFDDLLYLIYPSNTGAITIKEFPITTDPGKKTLKNPMNKAGTSILVPGQYIDSHVLGKHKQDYDALTQNGSVGKLLVWRDNNKDEKLDTSAQKFTDVSGLNIHRSNAKTESTLVGGWSAGCQVFKRAADFKFFMDVCKGSGQNVFTYTLLEEADF